MRKITVILLAFIYSLSAIGASATVHYCGGEFSSISLFSVDKKPCACPGKAMKKGCCESKTLTFKIKGDQSKLQAFDYTSQKSFDLSPALLPVNLHSSSPVHVSNYIQYAHRPPPDSLKQPLYILNGVFRI